MEKRKSMEWDQKTLASELTQGKELAKQLLNHLHPSASQETTNLLISKILFSYEKALLLLTRDVGSSDGTMLESPTSLGNTSPMSDFSDQDCKNKNVFKKRKTAPKWNEEVKICSGTALDGSLDDGYSWRKYGQKDILGATYPRGYYRCTHRVTQSCFATKHVQKSDADPSTVVITYRGEHSCSQVPKLARSSASLAKQALTGNQNATQEAEKPKPSQEMSFSFGAGRRVKTEDLDTREDDIFPSFSFPSTAIEPENVGDHIFCATLMDDYPTFASPAARFEPDYLQAVSLCHVNSFGLGHDYVQTSESGLSEIISAPTSVTNSPIGDFDFSLDDLDLYHFENPECVAYES